MSAILKDWVDIAGTNYVSNEAILADLLKRRMPRLLAAALNYAERIKDDSLAKRLLAIVVMWKEVFDVQ